MSSKEADDIPCPLAAPLTFTYQRGEGRVCLSPMSQVNKCIKDTQLLIRFQACPDIIQTESKGNTDMDYLSLKALKGKYKIFP